LCTSFSFDFGLFARFTTVTKKVVGVFGAFSCAASLYVLGACVSYCVLSAAIVLECSACLVLCA
jgi:hypothetical protein